MRIHCHGNNVIMHLFLYPATEMLLSFRCVAHLHFLFVWQLIKSTKIYFTTPLFAFLRQENAEVRSVDWKLN